MFQTLLVGNENGTLDDNQINAFCPSAIFMFVIRVDVNVMLKVSCYSI